MTALFKMAQAQVSALRHLHPVARVVAIGDGLIEVACMTGQPRLGDLATVYAHHRQIAGEVVRLSTGTTHLMLHGDVGGVALGDAVVLRAPAPLAPDPSWLGRVIDPDGNPLDGAPLLPGTRPMPAQSAPPPAHARRAMGKRLETGLAVLNTMLPIVEGQRIGLFAGSGVGKSTLLADLAKAMQADVVVLGLVGERGRELRHFVDDVLGPVGLARSVVVAATSDQPSQVRLRCVPTAMSIAEYFRDQGKHVLLLVDSMTRFCEAYRETHPRVEMSRGFPATMASVLANLCERAGPGSSDAGSITAVFTVLVAGSDMEEPVADMMRGILDGHIVMSRDIAERGRFPSIDVLRSVSRSLPTAATPAENEIIAATRGLLSAYDRAELMIQAGLYSTGSDPKVDAAISAFPQLETFFSAKDRRGTLAHFAQLRRITLSAG